MPFDIKTRVLSEGSQKLLEGLVSHKFTACLSVFNLLLTQ